MNFVNIIIEKLKSCDSLDDKEKAYIEKAILTAFYYEKLLDQDLGLEENTENLQFIKANRK